jgi:tripartite-type tricarboxylate transporter receptor subunit TctC
MARTKLAPLGLSVVAALALVGLICTSFASTVEYPVKGNRISLIVSFSAGGPNDVAARILAPFLQNELGIPVQLINKPGAGGQVGHTAMALAKPDGYTIGYATLPLTVALCLDPDRKAVFTRKSFQTLAMQVVDPGTIYVRSDSPYKTTNDLIDAAKANPEGLKVGGTGLLSDDDLALWQFEKATSTKR